MPAKKYRGLHELYATDPYRADEILWGRRTSSVSRRGFLKNTGLAAISTVLGAPMVYAANFPAGLIPAILAHEVHPFEIPGKHPDLIILNDRPLNAETPAHLLDSAVTGADVLFIRNNGIPPDQQTIDADNWQLRIDGEAVRNPLVISLAELKSNFRHQSLQLTIECGGNGRSEFQPAAKGNQWSVGAVGCPEWTGVRLKDVLQQAGLNSNAVYIGYYGADTHLSGNSARVSISRGVPVSKAMEEESLIAWAINGHDLPWYNGYPLRLVFGGWPASCSGKWLQRISVRDRVHDGEKMGGQSYRVPCNPVAPGASVADEDMCIIESMPVKSIITYPRSGAILQYGTRLPVRGHAWAGDVEVAKMEFSIDFGSTWHSCHLGKPANRLAWQQFSAEVAFPAKGYYEIWAKATDVKDVQQPMLVPGWNPKGYLNNACHRIAVKVV